MPAATRTPEQSEAIARYLDCERSSAYFIDHYGRINDPLAGGIPFRLWPFQYGILDTLDQHQRVILLKARQLGVSWLLAAYALWTAIFREGANVLLLSRRQDEATALLAKCAYIYDSLPAFLQPQIDRRNDTSLTFARSGSRIIALPATSDAGRSESATLVIVDEAAFHPYAADNYAGYKPAVDAGGKLVIVSTANGRGNWYHQMWSGAPANGFEPVFLSWRLRPGRDAEWWARQQREYAATPHLISQEYPMTAAEAFLSSGYCLFDTQAIDTALKGCRPPIETRLNGLLRIWQRPEPGRLYCCGADVAEGLDAGNDRLDYSGAAVLDARTGMHVADLHGQWPLDVFTQYLRDLCTEYNGCLLGIERNNHGHAVLQILLNSDGLRYRNVYYHEEIQAAITNRSQPTKRKVAGWPTTAKTKPLMEQGLAAAITSGRITSYDEAFWDECLSYVQHGDGKTGAQQGTHDDRVIKVGIALQMMGCAGVSARSMPLTRDFRFVG